MKALILTAFCFIFPSICHAAMIMKIQFSIDLLSLYDLFKIFSFPMKEWFYHISKIAITNLWTVKSMCAIKNNRQLLPVIINTPHHALNRVEFTVYFLIMPECLSSGSTEGLRPLKLIKSSIKSFEPPLLKIVLTKSFPTSGLRIPSSSNLLKASAERTSAHL